jgi:hypothetical protein
LSHAGQDGTGISGGDISAERRLVVAGISILKNDVVVPGAKLRKTPHANHGCKDTLGIGAPDDDGASIKMVVKPRNREFAYRRVVHRSAPEDGGSKRQARGHGGSGFRCEFNYWWLLQQDVQLLFGPSHDQRAPQTSQRNARKVGAWRLIDKAVRLLVGFLAAILIPVFSADDRGPVPTTSADHTRDRRIYPSSRR